MNFVTVSNAILKIIRSLYSVGNDRYTMVIIWKPNEPHIYTDTGTGTYKHITVRTRRYASYPLTKWFELLSVYSCDLQTIWGDIYVNVSSWYCVCVWMESRYRLHYFDWFSQFSVSSD